MFPNFEDIAQNFRPADALDLAVVTILFALTFHWMRRRSNKALLVVVLGLVGLYLVSHWLRMYLTLGLFRTGLTVAVIGVIIIFQNDLRHGFERLAAWRPFSSRPRARHREPLNCHFGGSGRLVARERIGAIIVLPAKQDLERHLNGGQRLEGHTSVPLLHSIFHTKSQGHDGAVVMRGNRVDRFAVHLPLSANFSALGPGGTRHAAALGLAEQSDALVIVVSEERGLVSLAQNGRLQTLNRPEELANRLTRFYRQGTKQQTLAEWASLFLGQFLEFCLGFAAAFFFWLMFAFQVQSVQKVVDQVPVESHNLPKDWVIESISPQQLRVSVAGPERAFAAFDWSTLRVALELNHPVNGLQTVIVGEESLKLPEEISLVRAEPSIVRVLAYKTQTVKLPVEVRTQGRLPTEWVLASKTPSVPSVMVKVRESLLSQIKSIPTNAIDLAKIDSSTTSDAQLVLPDGVWPSEEMPTNLKVNFQLKKREPPTPKKSPERPN